MALKKFNPETTPSSAGRVKQPSINISWKGGLLTFSIKAIEALKMTEHVQVEFAQDDESTSDWYLRLLSTGGFPVRKSSSGKLCFGSVTLAREILTSAGSVDRSNTVVIMPSPLKIAGAVYYKLDFSSVKKKKK